MHSVHERSCKRDQDARGLREPLLGPREEGSLREIGGESSSLTAFLRLGIRGNSECIKLNKSQRAESLRRIEPGSRCSRPRPPRLMNVQSMHFCKSDFSVCRNRNSTNWSFTCAEQEHLGLLSRLFRRSRLKWPCFGFFPQLSTLQQQVDTRNSEVDVHPRSVRTPSPHRPISFFSLLFLLNNVHVSVIFRLPISNFPKVQWGGRSRRGSRC